MKTTLTSQIEISPETARARQVARRVKFGIAFTLVLIAGLSFYRWKYLEEMEDLAAQEVVGEAKVVPMRINIAAGDNEALRAAGLLRSLQATGATCNEIESAKDWGTDAGRHLWRVSCGSDGTYLVETRNEVASRTVDCGYAQTINASCSQPARHAASVG